VSAPGFSCWFVFYWVVSSNKPDLALLFLLLLPILAMVVGSELTGGVRGAGSETLHQVVSGASLDLKVGSLSPHWVLTTMVVAGAQMRIWLSTSSDPEFNPFSSASWSVCPWSSFKLRRIFTLLPVCKTTAVVEEKQGRIRTVDLAVGEGAHHRWLLKKRHGACCGGRLPVFFDEPSNPLAERRSIFFLPAMAPDGRQYSYSTESMARCYGGVAAPSGAVPGDGDISSVRQLLGTQLQFLFASWGSPCKVQGPVCKGLRCNFSFQWSPFVRCASTMFI
jgi:hypothetical protein